MAFQPGQSGNPNGRPKGSENKSTKKCREVIGLIADDMADDFKAWLFLTAQGDEERGIKPDPKGAADLYLKAIEYHVPKLSRVEGHVAVEQKTHEEWLASLE
jgi:hypothetical protein